MKKILLIALLTFPSIICYSQIDSTKVAFVSYWSIGDRYDFKITKSSQQWKENKQQKNTKHEYIAHFEVVDSTANSYDIKWSYKNNLKSTYNIPQELLDKFSKYETTEIRYKTSEFGDLLEITNWEEVSKMAKNLFDDMVLILGKGDETLTNKIKKTIEPFRELYDTKEGIEELAVKELKYYHFPMGVEFDVTEPMYYEEELPNMFGGDPLKGNVKLSFQEVDFEDNFCILKQEMNIDPEDTKELLLQVLKKMNLENDEMDKMFRSAVFEIKDNNTYQYYYNPGVPHKIETIRETIIDINNSKGKRVDAITIELLYEE
ncbi:hypothetical protein Q4595_10955 [Wenyingzhuangia sp. 1_MG-2023]|nr:hypothetical protein [Wenyingzhuangia sp. 1_MG-2023]